MKTYILLRPLTLPINGVVRNKKKGARVPLTPHAAQALIASGMVAEVPAEPEEKPAEEPEEKPAEKKTSTRRRRSKPKKDEDE